jgi:hypothetical protein
MADEQEGTNTEGAEQEEEITESENGEGEGEGEAQESEPETEETAELTPEMRAALSDSWTPEMRAALGGGLTNEQRAQLSAAWTPEFRAAHSARVKAGWTPEVKIKMRNTMYVKFRNFAMAKQVRDENPELFEGYVMDSDEQAYWESMETEKGVHSEAS